MKKLISLFASAIITASLFGCGEKIDYSKLEPVTDPPISVISGHEPGEPVVLIGKHTLYVLTKSYKGIKAGMAMELKTLYLHPFVIAKLVQDNPEIRVDDVMKAAKNQLVELQLKAPETFLKEPIDENTWTILQVKRK